MIVLIHLSSLSLTLSESLLLSSKFSIISCYSDLKVSNGTVNRSDGEVKRSEPVKLSTQLYQKKVH